MVAVARAHKRRKPVRATRILLYGLLIAGSLVMAYPFAYGIAGSLCTTEAFLSEPYWLPLPRPITLDNYRTIAGLIAGPQFRLMVMNTIKRVAWYILIPGTVSLYAGYAFARLKFAGREQIFLLLLSSAMVPSVAYLIPTYVILARFPFVGGNDWLGQGGTGFINRWGSLLLPGMVNVVFIFLMRQAFLAIPRDFENAAQIDGAGRAQIMRHVYLPMVKSTLTVLALFQAVSVWNEYQWPLFVSVGNPKIWTVALGTSKAMSSAGPYSFALAIVMSLPTILLYVFLQRYFVEGMQGFAIKG